MTRVITMLMVIFAVLLPSVAHALVVTVCVDYSVDFTDTGAGTGDYFTSNTDTNAIGAFVRVTKNSSGTDVFSDYTDSSGCTTSLFMLSTETYTVRVYSWNYVNGNYIYVYDELSTSLWISTNETLSSTFSPTGNGTWTFDTGLDQTWRIAAAASWALSRWNGGMSGETYAFRNDPDNSRGNGTAWDRTLEVIYVGTLGARRYPVIHEMGHAMGHFKNGGASPNHDYTASYDTCYTNSLQAHEMNQKEYQSSGAWEGWAHFYSIVAFNNTSQLDCEFAYYKDVDWDLDSTVDVGPASCETSPITGVASADYLGTYCASGGATTTNRSTEYDWVRFWWDLHTDQAVPLNTIADIWDTSNPDTWNAADSGSASDFPATRLRNAANTEGYLTEWDAEDNYNGVHR